MKVKPLPTINRRLFGNKPQVDWVTAICGSALATVPWFIADPRPESIAACGIATAFGIVSIALSIKR